jgi:hypothetical protein
MDRFTSGARSAARQAWLAVLAGVGLTGCGGSGESASTPQLEAPQADGTLLVSVTDADGDFVGYSVDVLSVTLVRRGGATVEVLPARTRIDFAQLTDLADLLAVAALAPGDIVGGKIRLDYATAEVFVERGDQVVRANVVDADGQPLGVTELTIELAERERLVITRGRAALLALDFDLAASHEVDVASSPPVVAARPYIVAEVAPVTEKQLRLRGALVSADVGASTYTIDVRPWFQPQGGHGRITVHTTPATAFEIDGNTATGSAGLAALAQKPAGTLTVAFGTLTTLDRRFTAEIVHAGDSVSGERVDAVHGNIVARNGDRLIVKGAFAVRRDRVTRLHGTAIVTIGPDTRVLKTGTESAALDRSALSVGQNIVAFGTLVEPATPSAPATLDATNGRVRMLPTHLHGRVTNVVPGQLDLELRAIDRLGIELFDFAGTGVTPALDADPAHYEVATGSLSVGAIAAGQPAKVIGFVRPFGAAPPDFEGRTVVDHRTLPAVLGIGWGAAGTTAPFSSMNATGFVLDVDDASVGARHHLLFGGRIIDLTTLTQPPTLAPSAERALYGISVGREVRLFTTFAEFSSAVALELSAGKAAVALVASGRYDDATVTLTARHVAIHFAPAE